MRVYNHSGKQWSETVCIPQWVWTLIECTRTTIVHEPEWLMPRAVRTTTYWTVPKGVCEGPREAEALHQLIEISIIPWRAHKGARTYQAERIKRWSERTVSVAREVCKPFSAARVMCLHWREEGKIIQEGSTRTAIEESGLKIARMKSRMTRNKIRMLRTMQSLQISSALYNSLRKTLLRNLRSLEWSVFWSSTKSSSS